MGSVAVFDRMGDVTLSVASGSASLAALEAPPDSKSGDLGPGLIAFLIVAALAVATFFLIRSMLNHIRKVPPSFDSPVDNDPSADPGSDR